MQRLMVNGSDVKELMNGGTLIIPNMDSIAEFRVLTNNFDAEYGNYGGGIVNAVTKSRQQRNHGTGFEFLRNTDLDARNYFSPDRGVFQQNQFGGTIGGPLKKNESSSSATIRAREPTQGIGSGLISVPSLADRTGNLADQAGSLTGTVSGPYLANLLSTKLGYTVNGGERILHSRVQQRRAVRFPERDDPNVRMVRARAAFASVHSSSKHR